MAVRVLTHFRDKFFSGGQTSESGGSVSKDNQAYFLQRAAEETAAANDARSTAAAIVHRELALRYSLKLILPEPASMSDDERLIGQPSPVRLAAWAEPSGSPATRRRRA
jgi:hypothetical protein